MPRLRFALPLAAFLFAFGVWGGAAANAQSFLEKLEARVKEQLQQEPKSNSGELPAPAATPATPPNQVPPVVPAPAEQGNENGRIYLGLEAEGLVGGGIGVRVAKITERSPAWKAGFEVGDRILAINGFAIANLDTMVAQLQRTRPGQTVRFLISRAGKNMQLTAVLMDADLAARTMPGAAEPAVDEGPAWLGVIANDLTAAFRDQFGITVFRGAAVTRVEPGSPAASAGIRAGDAIIEAGGNPIEKATDLIAWMTSTKPGERTEMLVYRGGSSRVVEIVMASKGGPIARDNRSTAAVPSVADPAASLGLTSDPRSGTASSRDLPPVSTGPKLAPPRPEPAQPIGEIDYQQLANQLQQENAQLRQQLSEMQRQLESTQRRLDQIVDVLQADRK